MGYARVIQVAGWDALPLRPNKVNGVRSAFVHAGIMPEEMEFDPRPTTTPVSPEEIEALRKEAEREFGAVGVNSYGRMYIQAGWRNRKESREDESDTEAD